MRRHRAGWVGLLFLFTACLSAVGADDGADWTEAGARWEAQSYWQDPKLLQKYTFTPNPDDKIAGQSSVEVHMQVAAERPKDGIELRLIPPNPLDLSQAEAIEVSLKVLSGDGLRPTSVYLCSPGFQKLAMVSWPDKLDLSPGAGWERAVLDLVESRVLDKAKPNINGEYDRKDVSCICLNFALPKGAVDMRLLIDGMREAKAPPQAVKREKQPDGSFVFTTANYRAVVGADGYLQSLRSGPTEFLKTASELKPPAAGAIFIDNDPSKGIVPLDTLTPSARTGLEARGEKAWIRYVFREQDFDVVVEQTFARQGFLHFAMSPDVVAAFDGRTDRALRAKNLESGPQINTRLVTSTGAALVCDQYVVGYSRLSMCALPGKVWALQFLAYHPGVWKLTLRPMPQPTAPDAIGMQVECADRDFLLPGGKPVQFDITATSYARKPVNGRFTFQVCDYLTRKPVGERATPFTLEPGGTMAVPTDVALTEPGPYRGKVIVADAEGHERSIEWVFVYDFPNYKPASTRPADFHAFWKETLEDLAKVPLDAQITPVPEESTKDAEVFKVSLATLGGRRVHCWYWRPRKPGKYPARFEAPSSGIYPRLSSEAPRGEGLCGMWMAIHGLPVDVDTKNLPNDPAATGYWTHGIESPKTSMWRTIYASLVRGVDFLCSREEVDPKRIMVSGGSQGGGLSIVLAGLDRRIAFSSPAHSGLCRLDWTVLHEPGFWPFRMTAKPPGQTPEQFLKTLSYFDAANFTPDITCPVFAEVSLLDTVTASGNQICALAHVKPGLLELVCDPWDSHASDPRGVKLRGEAVQRWLLGQPPVQHPIKPADAK